MINDAVWAIKYSQGTASRTTKCQKSVGEKDIYNIERNIENGSVWEK